MSFTPPIPQELWDQIPPDVQVAVAATVEALERRIVALEARLGLNSRNSSDPPHIKRRPPVPSSGKKRGGQPGHKRHSRELVPPERLDHQVECRPPACSGCGLDLSNAPPDPHPIRPQVAEPPEVRPTLTEYRLPKLTRPGCDKAARGRLPQGVPSASFGPRPKTWVGLRSGADRLSKRQVRRMMADLLGLRISTGMVAKLQAQAALLEGPTQEILDAVRNAPAVHVDETGRREAGKKARLWVGVSAHATAFVIHPKRSRDGLDALLGDHSKPDRVVIVDRFSAYSRVPRRQICRSHPRRDFQAMVDRGSGGRDVGERLLWYSSRVFSRWEKLRAGTIARSTSRGDVAMLRSPVKRSLSDGMGCRCACTAEVCRKLLSDWRHLWRFASVEGVAPENDAAERALRHGVIWRKLSSGTAGAAGGRFVSRLLSVVETCRQRGRHRADYLTECFTAQQGGQAIPSPLT